MKIAIICNTYYQAYTAINLKYSFFVTDRVDVFIADNLESKKIKSIFEDENYFNNIYFFENKDITLGVKRKLRYIINNTETFVTNRRYECVLYDIILLSNISAFACKLYAENKMKNKNLEIILFEDGLRDYVLNYMDYIQKNKFYKKMKFIYRLINKPFINQNTISKCYIYNKDLVSFDNVNKFNYKNIEVNPKIAKNDIIKVYDNAKYIYFDQPLNDDNEEVNEIQIFNELKKYINKKILIKMHPRQKSNTYENFNCECYSSTIPWELEVLNINIEEKVLITYNSTAILTPFLLYKKKPIVIFLFNIYNNDNNIIINKFLSKVKEIYGDRMILIKEYKEVVPYLKEIKKDDKNE